MTKFVLGVAAGLGVYYLFQKYSSPCGCADAAAGTTASSGVPAVATVAGASMNTGAAASTTVGGDTLNKRLIRGRHRAAIEIAAANAKTPVGQQQQAALQQSGAAKAIAQVAAADVRRAIIPPSPNNNKTTVLGIQPVQGTLPAGTPSSTRGVN